MARRLGVQQDVRRFGFQSWDDGTRLYRASRPGHPASSSFARSIVGGATGASRPSLMADPSLCLLILHSHIHFFLSSSSLSPPLLTPLSHSIFFFSSQLINLHYVIRAYSALLHKTFTKGFLLNNS